MGTTPHLMGQMIASLVDLSNYAPNSLPAGSDAAWAHELIARQASASPDTLAVRDEQQDLTFAQLDQRANRLARHLVRFNVGTETPVGLFFDRTVDFVVAALAVLKTGGAYVPLDAGFPPARIDAILKDAGVPVLLSHKWMAASLAGGPWKTVDLLIDAASIAGESAEPLAASVTGNQLAYIAYTSGSTGHPKGVEVTHGNLQHLIHWHQRAFNIMAHDRASQIAGLAFDAAVWEMWCHLTAGASLHLIDEASRRSPEALLEWLVAKKITIAFVPTVMAEYLITLDWPASTSLRILLTGADTLHRYPNAGLPFTLVNNYGPTECTVLVTSGPVLTEVTHGPMPPIGRPIDDMEILILDAGLSRVADGADGEICAAGPQVARGYRNLPAITAEKFVQEPATGRRIYRTGDRGRRLSDGQIAFLGRIDDQIKIRGFRVEPDEIVTQLNAHPQVRNSAVVTRGEDADSKTLVGYVSLAAGAVLTASELRDHLRSRVPDYMIPSAFVNLPALPVTATGKCDKQSLPAPAPSNLLPESSENKPSETNIRSGSEARIAQLVSGLMEGRSISRNDNFFLVGGHSMLAAQLLARIREGLLVTLNLRQLFEAPTIASLAAVVDQKLAAK